MVDMQVDIPDKLLESSGVSLVTKRKRGNSAEKEVKKSEKTKDKTSPKRGWDSWDADEKEFFFNALKECGRNFDVLTQKVATKSYDQVRHFYYRLLKKVDKLIAPKVVDKKDQKEVVHALLSYWELTKSAPGSTSKEESTKDISAALKELISKRSSLSEDLAAQEKKRNVRAIIAGPASKEAVVPAPTLIPLTTLSAGPKQQQPVDKRQPRKSAPLPNIAPLTDSLDLSQVQVNKNLLLEQNPVQSKKTKKDSIEEIDTPHKFLSLISPPQSPKKVVPFTKGFSNIVEGIAALTDIDSKEIDKKKAAARPTTNAVTSSPPTDPDKILILCTPKDQRIDDIMTLANRIPRLQVTMKRLKSMSYLVNFLTNKWVYEQNGETIPLASAPIRLYPSEDLLKNANFPRGFRGWWDRNDSVTIEEVYNYLNRPSTVKFCYTWLMEEPQSPVQVPLDLNSAPPTPLTPPPFTSSISAPSTPQGNNNLLGLSTSRYLIRGNSLFSLNDSTDNILSPQKTFKADSSLFEDASCDGFGVESERAELECKSFYDQFNSIDNTFDQPDKRSSQGSSSGFKLSDFFRKEYGK